MMKSGVQAIQPLESSRTKAAAATKPRSATIDVAKGVGILLIVLGHSPIFSEGLEFLSGLLASFRIPFFFFMSGMTLSLGTRSASQVALLRADAWLKPCAVVLIAIGVMKIVTGRGTIEGALLGLVYGTGFTFPWPPLWFLPQLWLVYVSCTWLLTRGQSLLDSRVKQIILLAVLSIGGYYLMHLFDSPNFNPVCKKQLEFTMHLLDCGLPYSADLLPITAFYFLIGYFLSTAAKSFTPSVMQMVISILCLTAVYSEFPLPVDLNIRVYDNVLMSPVLALLGIYAMLCVCCYLAKMPAVASVISYFGRLSLFILLFHAPVLYWLVKAMPLRVHQPVIIGITAFVVPIAVSVGMYYLCKQSKVLSLLMFPIKRKQNIAPPQSSVDADR